MPIRIGSPTPALALLRKMLYGHLGTPGVIR
jgi:hypothetical protein